MRYLSTRGGDEAGLLDAVLRGLATDGGLFVPDELPRFAPDDFKGGTLAEISTELLTPFFAGSGLERELGAICSDAFDFPVPLRTLIDAHGELSLLELFHGPTAAFKDVGARFLAAVMERALPLAGSDRRPLTILVATSGDTGGAVAAAFHGRSNIRVGVLFPKGQVSPRQQQQLTCWGDNIRAFEVGGVFDDCQALVKAAFADPGLHERHRLTAANSINIGRILPQAAYHAAASLWHWRSYGTTSGSIIPTGNLGNGMACVWARAMGLPIREIVLAVNANRTVPDYLATGQWQPRAAQQTLASAMDVGNPSNMERLRNLLPDFADLREAVEAYPVDDESIRAQIAKDYQRYGEIWCPHTATAFWVYDQLPAARKSARPWIVSATAHPAKFETIVEPLIGREVLVPPALRALLDRPTSRVAIEPKLAELAAELDKWSDEDHTKQ
jgi:threonine synthase